jgi:hypothetical protein
LVGENSCQIRGVYIAMMVNYSESNIFPDGTRMLQKVNQALNAIDNASQCLYTTFDITIENNNLEIELTADETYLFQCFVLTEAKSDRLEVNGDKTFRFTEIIEKDKLKKYGEHKALSTEYYLQLTKKLKHSVSKTSVCFLERQVTRVFPLLCILQMFRFLFSSLLYKLRKTLLYRQFN